MRIEKLEKNRKYLCKPQKAHLTLHQENFKFKEKTTSHGTDNWNVSNKLRQKALRMQ